MKPTEILLTATIFVILLVILITIAYITLATDIHNLPLPNGVCA